MNSQAFRQDQGTAIVQPSRTVVGLSMLVALLAALAAASGLFWEIGSDPVEYTTARGEVVERYGNGLYRYDTLFRGAGFRGADAAILLIAVPLHLYALRRYTAGSLAGFFLLNGTLAFLLYNYASMALGAAYNPFLLLYIVLFSATLFGFLLSWRTVDIAQLKDRFSDDVPWRGVGTFMIASGVVTLVVWMGPLVTALLSGDPPDLLDGQTTMVTEALDLAIIVPATWISGVLLLRRDARGVLIAFPLLMILLILGPVIVGQTISQVSAGVELSAGEIIGPVSGFILLALLDLWIIRRLLAAAHH